MITEPQMIIEKEGLDREIVKRIKNTILDLAQKERQVVYGQQSVNIQLPSKFRRETKATTFSGYLLTCIKNLRDANNIESAKLTETYYKKFKEYSPKKENKIDIIGWKGKGQIDFNKDLDDDVSIKEFRKSKETGEIEITYHIIPKENINFIKNLIKKLNIGDSISYRALARQIIDKKGLKINLDSFNGGKNRALFYFPYYYYPIKVMEYCEIIKYSGRGKVTRLK